jgi:MarR family transcriptional regulator, organic hydroperoxide resistance regulator
LHNTASGLRPDYRRPRVVPLWLMPRSRERRARRKVTSDTALEFLRLLWAFDHQLQRASKRLTRDLGVTGPQRLAVRMIATHPGISPQDVAAALYLHKSTVTGILQRLEDQGLIGRAVDPADKRRARLHLTSHGERISNYKGPTIERAVQRVLSHMSEPALGAARQVLAEIAKQLEEGTERRRHARRARASRVTPSRD